ERSTDRRVGVEIPEHGAGAAGRGEIPEREQAATVRGESNVRNGVCPWIDQRREEPQRLGVIELDDTPHTADRKGCPIWTDRHALVAIAVGEGGGVQQTRRPVQRRDKVGSGLRRVEEAGGGHAVEYRPAQIPR